MDFLKSSDLAGCGCYRWSCPRNTRQFSKGWRKWWNLLKQQDFGEGSEVVEFSVNMSLLAATTLQCLGRIFLNEDILSEF